MLKILQARLQQYVNRELPDIHSGFRKCRGTRGQVADIHWLIEKAREFQKNIYFCSLNMRKPLIMWITTSLKILKEIGLPNHFTCLLRNLYAGQEATVRTRNGKTDWLKVGKGVQQGFILSSCMFNLHAEYIMWNARLEHKLEWRLLGEISVTSDVQMTPSLSRKWKRTKEPFDESERRVKKLA